MIGFIIWAVVGVVLIVIGICDLFSKKPVGFWANAETMKVNDVKGYNRATGFLLTNSCNGRTGFTGCFALSTGIISYLHYFVNV